MKTNPRQSWFEVRNAIGGRAEISIMDEIGMFGVSAGDFRDVVKSLPPSQPILLRLNTPGGDIVEGNEIYNILTERGGDVEVECGALVASIGTVIAMAGNPITMPRNGFFMVHNPWSLTIGDSEDHRKSAEVMDKMKDGIIDSYARRTGKTAKELGKMMDEETWMTADEALENGFINSIREEDETSAKNFDLSKFRNSASFARRLQKQNEPAKGLAGTGGGNSSDIVTLSDLEDAAKPLASTPVIPVQPTTLPNKEKPKMEALTEEQKTAQKNEIEKMALARAKELVTAQNKRNAEIDDIVNGVKTREGRDFSNVAGKFKQDSELPLADLYKAIAEGKGFEKIDPQNVIGSGVEIVDEFRGRNVIKGSPGEQFVASEEYAKMRDSLTRGGSNKPRNVSIQTGAPADVLRNSGILGSPVVGSTAEGPAIQGFKNVVTDSGLVSQQDIPGVYALGVRQLKVKDVLMGGVTNSIQIRYIQETSFTNGALTVAEGATKPAVTVSVAQVTAPVQKIAAYIKVTDELWADFPAVASLINMRLPYMVERTEEDQLLNGDGTNSNLTGLLQTAGIQTQAVGADTQADAIFKAIMKVINGPGLQTGGYPVDWIIINPISWQALRLAKDANNQYYGGGPFTAAYGSGPLVTADSFWGRPTVVTPAIAAGKALVGSRMAAQYFQRMGLMIESTNTDQDDFIKNLTTIRAEERLALTVPLPLGLCQVTGLATV